MMMKGLLNYVAGRNEEDKDDEDQELIRERDDERSAELCGSS